MVKSVDQRHAHTRRYYQVVVERRRQDPPNRCHTDDTVRWRRMTGLDRSLYGIEEWNSSLPSVQNFTGIQACKFGIYDASELKTAGSTHEAVRSFCKYAIKVARSKRYRS